MAFKSHDPAFLQQAMAKTSEMEIQQQIDALVDKKLLFTLAKLGAADLPDASGLVNDAAVQAELSKLKNSIASLMWTHEQLIAAVAKERLEGGKSNHVKEEFGEHPAKS